MKLTKGLSRTAVGAWSRSVPLRGTTPRPLLDWSPSQLIQVFYAPSKEARLTDPTRRNYWAGFWPPIVDQASARAVSRQAMWASLVVAGITVIVSQMQVLGLNNWALLDAGLFVTIAYGIHRMSRVVAVAGLLLFLVERVVMFQSSGRTGGLVALAILVAFIHGVRGTIAFHRLRKTESDAVAVPEG